MKIKFLTVSIAAILTLLIASCSDDFFELKYPQETQWVNTLSFEAGISEVNRCIHWTRIGNAYNVSRDIYPSGFISKVWAASVGGGGDIFYERQFDQQTESHPEAWTNGYAAIAMCYAAIALDEHTSHNPFNLNVDGADYRDNYQRLVAEYYFNRGYAYLMLAKFFVAPWDPSGSNDVKAIPLIVEEMTGSQQALNMQTGTRQQIYDQIVSDLKKAKDGLPEHIKGFQFSAAAGYEVARANKFVASAMLGKVYFMMGKFAEAKAEFDYVIDQGTQINGQPFRLADDPAEIYNKYLRTEAPSSDAVWEFNCGNNAAGHSGYPYEGLQMSFRFRDSNSGPIMKNAPGQTMVRGWCFFSLNPWATEYLGWTTPLELPANPPYGEYKGVELTEAAKGDKRIGWWDWTAEPGQEYKSGTFHYLRPIKTRTQPGALRTQIPDPTDFETKLGLPWDTLPAAVRNGGLQQGHPLYLSHEARNDRAWFINHPYLVIDKFNRGPNGFGRYSRVPYIKLSDLLLIRGWIKWKTGDPAGAAADCNLVWNRSNPGNPNKFSAGTINDEEIFKEYVREMFADGYIVDFMMATRRQIPPVRDFDGLELHPAINPPYQEWHWAIPPAESNLNPNL